jgi:hypothetical protein
MPSQGGIASHKSDFLPVIVAIGATGFELTRIGIGRVGLRGCIVRGRRQREQGILAERGRLDL